MCNQCNVDMLNCRAVLRCYRWSAMCMPSLPYRYAINNTLSFLYRPAIDLLPICYQCGIPPCNMPSICSMLLIRVHMLPICYEYAIENQLACRQPANDMSSICSHYFIAVVFAITVLSIRYRYAIRKWTSCYLCDSRIELTEHSVKLLTMRSHNPRDVLLIRYQTMNSWYGTLCF